MGRFVERINLVRTIKVRGTVTDQIHIRAGCLDRLLEILCDTIPRRLFPKEGNVVLLILIERSETYKIIILYYGPRRRR